MTLSIEELIQMLDGFEGRKIAVLGDFYLDRYIWGNMEAISREAPVPIVRIEHDVYSPGAAGNTALNVRALGGAVYVVGVIGEDISGEIMRREFARRGIDDAALLTDRNRHTPTFSKIYAASYHGKRQQVARFDRENEGGIATDAEEELLRRVEDVLDEADALIVADYAEVPGTGTITDGILQAVGWIARARSKPSVGDSRDRIAEFAEFTAVVPNDYEAAMAAGVYRPHSSGDIHDDTVIESGERLLERIGGEAVLVTRGERGMTVFRKEGWIHVPTVPAQGEIDVTGAGDTVTAVIALALSGGVDLVRAAEIGNLAGAVTVGKLGTTGTATKEEIVEMYRRLQRGGMGR